jgi:dyslexia susceptibility 1 candidate gene 1 protein
MGQEIDDRNPIWIKEKGDNFFKNKDYRSAINAYNRALELDQDFHKCYLNRSTCLFLMGEFDLSLQDLNKLIYMLDTLDSQEKEDPFYTKLLLKAKIKSYAINSILNNYSEALTIIDSILDNKENSYILGDKVIEKIIKDRKIIENRKISEEEKLDGDKFINNEKNYEKARKIYEKIIYGEKSEILEKNGKNEKKSEILEKNGKNVEKSEISQKNGKNEEKIEISQISQNFQKNEKILSNLSLISLTTKNYTQTIFYTTEVLKIIKNFKEKISLNSKKFDNSLELKILLRRAESYVELNEMTKAQEDIELAERFEIRNREILEKFNFFKEKLKTIVLENYSKTANEMLKNKQFSEALQLYDRSISLIKKKERVEQIKFYLNRTSCLIALGQYENVINECSRIYAMLNKQKNISTINSNLNLLKILRDLEFHILVKRAFGFSKSGKIEEARSDYLSALEINPNDSNVKKNLAALNY